MELAEFLKFFDVQDLLDMKEVEKQDAEYFLIPHQLRELRRDIGRKAVYIGTFLGATRGVQFVPSLELLDLLNGVPHVKKVIVNPKAEWLFITNKNILSSSVARTIGKLFPGDAVLVLNQHGEAIGCGSYASDPAKKVAFVIQHRFDIGDFLRRERRLPKPVRRH
jgi:ribosome biogenesis protein Nip4